MKILRRASLGSNFTGSYKKKECNILFDNLIPKTYTHLLLLLLSRCSFYIATAVFFH